MSLSGSAACAPQLRKNSVENTPRRSSSIKCVFDSGTAGVPYRTRVEKECVRRSPQALVLLVSKERYRIDARRGPRRTKRRAHRDDRQQYAGGYQNPRIAGANAVQL